MTPALLNDRYRVIRVLASGGFGETWLAEDSFLPSKRLCVIKQLKRTTDNPQIHQLVHERFQREAAILEELGHASSQIPELYAYFEETGRFYLVQEWIEGQTLVEKLRVQGILSEVAVRQLLEGILPVLSYIHDRGIIHRDLKPDNIILRQPDEQPVLIDFGAVKETVGTVLNSQGQTVSSIVIGTPGYMPSEQAAGRPIFSSDLFSLGLTAIYLLTGKHPQTLAIDPRTGEFIWRPEAPAVSDALAGIIDRAIQYHPRDRFSTAQEMLSVLKLTSQPIHSSMPQAVSAPMQTAQVPSTTIPPTQAYASVVSPQAVAVSQPPSLPSVPPTQVPSTAPSPSSWALNVAGVVTALLVCSGGVYLYYRQQQPYRDAQAVLQEIETLHLQGDYSGCIRRAQVFPNAFPQLLNQAQRVLADCLLAKDKQTLQAAVDIASQPNANLGQAIAQAGSISRASLVRPDAEHYILKWQTTVLQNYLDDHSSESVTRLDPIVEEITTDTVRISYDSSSNPRYAQEAGVRIVTALFMELLQGSDKDAEPQYADFDHLVTYPRQGDLEGKLTSEQWQTYLNAKSADEKSLEQLKKDLLNQIQLINR